MENLLKGIPNLSTIKKWERLRGIPLAPPPPILALQAPLAPTTLPTMAVSSSTSGTLRSLEYPVSQGLLAPQAAHTPPAPPSLQGPSSSSSISGIPGAAVSGTLATGISTTHQSATLMGLPAECRMRIWQDVLIVPVAIVPVIIHPVAKAYYQGLKHAYRYENVSPTWSGLFTQQHSTTGYRTTTCEYKWQTPATDEDISFAMRVDPQNNRLTIILPPRKDSQMNTVSRILVKLDVRMPWGSECQHTIINKKKIQVGPLSLLNILLIGNKKFYNEATEVFYSQNTFLFCLGGMIGANKITISCSQNWLSLMFNNTKKISPEVFEVFLNGLFYKKDIGHNFNLPDFVRLSSFLRFAHFIGQTNTGFLENIILQSRFAPAPDNPFDIDDNPNDAGFEDFLPIYARILPKMTNIRSLGLQLNPRLTRPFECYRQIEPDFWPKDKDDDEWKKDIIKLAVSEMARCGKLERVELGGRN